MEMRRVGSYMGGIPPTSVDFSQECQLHRSQSNGHGFVWWKRNGDEVRSKSSEATAHSVSPEEPRQTILGRDVKRRGGWQRLIIYVCCTSLHLALMLLG